MSLPIETNPSSQPGDTAVEVDVRRVGALLRGFDVGMLITLGGAGAPHARPMAIAEVTSDGRIGFVTERASRMAREIETDERVAIALQAHGRYLFLLGSADVHPDRARVDRLWRESWKAWFPRGRDDPELCLIEVFPTEAEVWSATEMNATRGVRYVFDTGAGALGEHGFSTGTRPHDDVP